MRSKDLKDSILGESQSRRGLIAGWLIRENPNLKWMIWGYIPLFQETPIYAHIDAILSHCHPGYRASFSFLCFQYNILSTLLGSDRSPPGNPTVRVVHQQLMVRSSRTRLQQGLSTASYRRALGTLTLGWSSSVPKKCPMCLMVQQDLGRIETTWVCLKLYSKIPSLIINIISFIY